MQSLACILSYASFKQWQGLDSDKFCTCAVQRLGKTASTSGLDSGLADSIVAEEAAAEHPIVLLHEEDLGAFARAKRRGSALTLSPSSSSLVEEKVFLRHAVVVRVCAGHEEKPVRRPALRLC